MNEKASESVGGTSVTPDANIKVVRESAGQYSEHQGIDAECERLLRNTKKQVKQMMEEAVTKKSIHEESSSIICLCVAVDACLTHGLKRRALGLFKTSSSTALIQKLAKSCESAQQVLDSVCAEEKRHQLTQHQQQDSSGRSGNFVTQVTLRQQRNTHTAAQQLAANYSSIHKRNMWIKCALIEGKLVNIVEHLAENASKYYEQEALISNYLCAQILSSLLVGPSALEFSRGKLYDSYRYEDPTANELIERHKLANPIACLCSADRLLNSSSAVADQQYYNKQGTHKSPSKQRQDLENKPPLDSQQTPDETRAAIDNRDEPLIEDQANSVAVAAEAEAEISQAPSVNVRKGRSARRRPLALKGGVATGTLVTDCHHYSCQEISEHQQVRGYSLVSAAITSTDQVVTSHAMDGGCLTHGTVGHSGVTSNCVQAQQVGGSQSTNRKVNNCEWAKWSPRMLHETLHQNSRSRLLYAKNNVLLETQNKHQPQTLPGYLSLHELSSDLFLKWIPNQMINGTGHASCCCSDSPITSSQCDTSHSLAEANAHVNSVASGQTITTIEQQPHPQVAVESSYLELVVNLPISRVVLLQCQFNSGAVVQQVVNEQERKVNDEQVVQVCRQTSSSSGELDTLILVEADGVQGAPFKFPKGSLKLFLSCLESGLQPSRYLEPAIKFHNNAFEPLQGQLVCSTVSSPPIGVTESSTTFCANGDQSPTSRFDSILKRFPSLKRRNQPQTANSADADSSSIVVLTMPKNADQAYQRKADNCVYRIISLQQPTWPLTTPPHSAISTTSLPPIRSTGRNERFCASQSEQKFRWSLSRLAKFSSRYTNSGSTSTTSPVLTGCCDQITEGINAAIQGKQQASCTSEQSTDGSLSMNNENTACSLKDESLQESNDDRELMSKLDSSKELARIEAKLDHLKKSTSDDVLATLRTQSIQTLCESMRKQIVARAFYGWLVHCRKVRIIRIHLKKLLKTDTKLLINEYDENLQEYKTGLTRVKWEKLMRNNEQSGSREEDVSCEINRLVYYGGIENSQLRKEVWPYLLEHYSFDEAADKRKEKDDLASANYKSSASDWIKIERVVKQRDRELLAANMAKANREAKKQSEKRSLTNINHDMKDLEIEAVETNSESTVRTSKDPKTVAVKRRRRKARLESTGSVGSDASITDHFGNNIHRIDKDVQRCDRNFWYFKDTENLDKLRRIMCTYVWHHLDVGYVQGMCDLAAPFLVVFDDEVLAYTCFGQLMKRLVFNFPHGNAMDQHFESLKHLMQILDPKLFDILQSNGDYTHFYFCYRWLLLDFKRELAYEDVYRVWETIWSARFIVTDNFVVFMALAMVRYYRDIIIENNMDFTDTIKFFNEMAECHNTKKILALAQDCIVELQNLIET